MERLDPALWPSGLKGSDSQANGDVGGGSHSLVTKYPPPHLVRSASSGGGGLPAQVKQGEAGEGGLLRRGPVPLPVRSLPPIPPLPGV